MGRKGLVISLLSADVHSGEELMGRRESRVEGEASQESQAAALSVRALRVSGHCPPFRGSAKLGKRS